MNKRKMLIIIISVLLVILVALGVILYISHSKSNEKEMFEETSTEGATFIPIDSKEEVIEEIKNFHTSSKDATVAFEKEEDDCWYFNDSDGNKYMYCLNNPEIQKLLEK